jgi:hypothetical protein
VEISVGGSERVRYREICFETGYLVRHNPQGTITAIGFSEGKLESYKYELHEESKNTFLICGHLIEIMAKNQAEADYYLVQQLIERELLQRGQ